MVGGLLTRPHTHCLTMGTGIQGTWSDHSQVDNKVIRRWDQNHEPLMGKSRGAPPFPAAGLTPNLPSPPSPVPIHVSIAATGLSFVPGVMAPRVNTHVGVSTSGLSVSVERAQENGRSQPRHEVASPRQGPSVRLCL